MCTHRPTRGAESPVSSDDMGDLARAMGIDPSTLPDPNAPSPSRDRYEETASEYLDRIITEHDARDLTDAEATLLISAIWVQPRASTTIDKARGIWRMVTFMRRYKIPLRSLPETIMPPWTHRTGSSSTVHRWAHAGFWSRAQAVLSPLPYSEWSQERRDELADLVEWETTLRASAEKRKAKRIHDIALRAQVWSRR